MTHTLRQLPSVSSLLEHPEVQAELGATPRTVLVSAIRTAIARVRSGESPLPEPGAWPSLIARELAHEARSSLARVVNATGVVLHTNLGRAPLAPEALRAITEVAAGYSTLEFDLESGQRGSRHDHCVRLLREVTGCEDALVVNNCAAALVLALNTLAAGRAAIVSRGELIEIGGSFRIPDIMARSTARLVEVGTTNRTHPLDYRAAINEQTAAIVKVHRSNFAMSGFVTDVQLHDLAPIAREHDLPLVFDLGSGLLIDLAGYGFPAEPTAGSALSEGADVVLLSGDKLLGGPQSGIIVGRADVIERMRSNPLARALRTDKLTLAALEATLRLYRDPGLAVRSVPVLAMLTAPAQGVRARAEDVASRLARLGHPVSVTPSDAAAGAGAFPAHRIPSAAVTFSADAHAVAARLRAAPTPVIGRLHDEQLLLDLRTVREHEEDDLVAMVHHALSA